MLPASDGLARLRRLWRPRHPLFRLMLVFNALSSGMAWALHLARPEGALLWILTLLALGNAVAGMVLLWRLWQETAADPEDANANRPDGRTP
jgi:hypothetical protein